MLSKNDAADPSESSARAGYRRVMRELQDLTLLIMNGNPQLMDSSRSTIAQSPGAILSIISSGDTRFYSSHSGHAPVVEFSNASNESRWFERVALSFSIVLSALIVSAAYRRAIGKKKSDI